MAYGAVVGSSVLGYASSASIPVIVVGAVYGFFAGAVIVTMHKLSGFARCPRTRFRARMQKAAFVALLAIVAYTLFERAWTRDWFEFWILLFFFVPFALLSRGLIARLLISNASADTLTHESGKIERL